MQVSKEEPKNKMLLIHKTCLMPEADKNRHPRGLYYNKVPCYCGRCNKHFENGQMTFWIVEDIKPDQNE